MSIEQPQVAVSDIQSSAIENEIPAYRAISALAVVSLIFGVLSVLSFTDYWFLVFSGLAILTCIMASRKIDRMPEILTGKTLAHAGASLGIIFGLTSVTISTVQYYLRANQASIFANELQDVLFRGSMDEAIFLHQPPEMRKKSSPEQMAETLKKSGPEGHSAEMQFGQLKVLKQVLATKESEIQFEGIQNVGDDGVTIFAAAVYDVKAPENPAPLPKDGHALALLKGYKKNGKYEWYIEAIQYPFNSKDGYVAPTKPVDDGHGH